MVPRRSFVLRKDSLLSRLPDSVPIIGIGGSAFSNFFLSPTELDSSVSSQLTVDNVCKEHPKVQQWLSVIYYAIVDRGITLIDTAAWYGHGLSEIIIGYAMAEIFQFIDRTELTINTKIGRYDEEPSKQFDYSYDRTIAATRLSILRMKCQYIDVLQLHDPEYSPSIQLLLDETIPALIYCRDELKLCRALGITGYPLDIQHEILVRSAQLAKNHTTPSSMIFDMSLTYCHFNLHDSSLFSSNLYNPYKGRNDHLQKNDENSFASFCFENSIGLMAAAPYSMGLLTKKGTQHWHPASSDLKEACRQTVLLCNQYHLDVSSLALLYALSQPAIACTVVGMGSVEEVDHACDIACRFYPVGMNDGDKEPEVIQRKVLTDTEYDVLSHILDRKNGPFAAVYESVLDQWDALALAAQFWENITGGKEEAEAQMRVRSSNEQR